MLHRCSFRGFFAAAAVWSVGLLCAASAVAAAAPRWPLDLPTRYLTSNFMEHRSGRFHAGLDLKTQTVTGFAVHAPEDGWILRVRATPGAYGRAVYLRGNSGRTYVCAHLSRFNDVLRGYLAKERAQTGTYRVQRSFAPHAVPIRRGDVLGLTGQSGTHGPHLHFEVRDARNRPVDPQTVGFAVPDTIAPVIFAVRAWPVRPETLVQGVTASCLLTAEKGLVGRQGSLRVTGPVAFSARIVEKSDIKGHRLEPSLIEVHLDGELVYRCHNEGFAFADNAAERLEWVEQDGVREHWLHRRPADNLRGRSGSQWYQGRSGDGLAPGRHLVAISAGDVAGNQTKIVFDLVVDAGPHGALSLESQVWKPVPDLDLVGASDPVQRIRLTPFFDNVAAVVWPAESPVLHRVYRPELGDPVQAACTVVSYAADLTVPQKQKVVEQGLANLGAIRSFVAADWPIEASLPVEMPRPSEGGDVALDHWGLYRWGGQRWHYASVWSAGVAGESSAAVHIDLPGVYAVLADTVAPRFVREDPLVVTQGPVSQALGVTLPHWTILPVDIVERGSGLSAGSIRAVLDGKSLIVEPDLPRDRLLVAFPDDMVPGVHSLVLQIADEAGQTAVERAAVLAR